MNREILYQGFGCFVVLMVVFVDIVPAASYDLKVMTPEVKQAIENRQARYGSLERMKTGGAVGENNQGYVEALKALPEARNLANAENRDRRVIYTAIVSQNNLDPGELSVVESVFADVQREKAGPGDSIQRADGTWTKK